MKTLALLLCLFPLCAALAADTNDLEFLEAFAWGDRQAALKELVPDTEDYYYYHCLDYQLSNNRVAFDKTLEAWYNHNNRNWNSRMNEMRRRQKLITFDQTPDQTWSFIRNDAHLTFSHRPRNQQRNPTYPSVLRPEQYSLQAFLADTHNGGLLNDLTPRGLEIGFVQDKNPMNRRAFLGQLQQPDIPNLVDLIVADLNYKNSRGFGSFPIDRLLTRAQLEELGQRKPDLLRDQDYVTERLARIQPPEVDLSHDHQAAIAYYQETWDFVRTLGDSQNSLKASTLYRLLDHQRQTGVYDEALFQTYLQFPRQVSYLPQKQRELWQRQRAEWVNFHYQPGRNIILPPIGQEEPLVHDFLITLLQNAPNPDAYSTYFETKWLNAQFAESKILNGVGKPEDWAHLLTPQRYRQILDRIELNFAPENPAYVTPGENISLQVDLKRIDTLLVKIYEMQTFNYYQTHRAPMDQAVDLDGMVPTFERQLDVKSDPGRRVRHSLALPEIKARGVYVVELIGNGVSSRALLHVGHLESITQATASGQVMVVLNEAGETVEHAKVWLDGREYSAGKQGLILLPYSENPGTRFVILQDGSFSSPENFMHLGEDYAFTAGIHIDAQSLNRLSTGTLLLRPDLRIHGIPLDPALLKDVNVTLASTDAKGTRSEREFPAEFLLNEDWGRSFYVPDGLRQLEVSVHATIQRKSDLEEITLSDQYVLNVNNSRSGDTLRQVFLVPHQGGWSLEVRGLNGEAIADEPMTVYLSHPAFRTRIDLQVTTNDQGQVDLGPLSEISHIQVSGRELELNLALEGGKAVLPSQINLQPQQSLSLPYPYERQADLRAASLFQKGRGGVNLVDLGDLVKIANGQLQISGLEAGDYSLTLHEPGISIQLKVVAGENSRGYILGQTERVQATDRLLASVSEIKRTADNLHLNIRNPKQGTRVSVRAYRYETLYDTFPSGFGYPNPSMRKVYAPHTQYISGRNIGDEYRYVLDRKFQKIFAGTLLERPGLILNPWMLRETEANLEELKADEAYRGERQKMNAVASSRTSVSANYEYADDSSRSVNGGWAEGQNGQGRRLIPGIGFDFLPAGAKWWTNLEPDAKGNIELPLKELGEHTALEIIVMDRFGTTISRETLPDQNFKPAEVRLVDGLNPQQNFSRQKNIRLLAAGKDITFPDLTTTRYQVIGDFSTAFDLLQTLNGDSRLQDFSFLKSWPQLDQKTKQEKYGKYASHELHLFLYQRDPAFFTSTVKPYLQNKKNKTFVDRWLLDELLPEDTRMDFLQQRNALELALLARRGGNSPAMQAALREAWELLPPNPDAFARRVQIALQANELDEVASLKRDQIITGMKAEQSSRITAGMSTFGGRSRMPEVASAPMPSVSLDLMQEKAMPQQESATEMESKDMDALMEISKRMDDTLFAEVTPRLYRALPKTKEWAEQNYYELRTEQDQPGYITVNQYWQDVAASEAVSPHLLQANRNLNEVLAALAFCGLPFEAEKPTEAFAGTALTLSAKSTALLVSEQILPAEKSKDDRPLLISQQFFRPDDLYRYEDNEQIEKFISGEFIRRTVYGARVTLTNPTATRRRLNVLMQLPLGAIPLRNGFYTDDRSIVLNPYTTQTVEYFFTFPESGTFVQFPAHASDKEAIIGQAEARVFEVKDAPTEVDKTSWAWVSQYASDQETLSFLRTHNLRRLDLNEMAWRLKDQAFFTSALRLLEARGLFHYTTYSYGIFHQDIPVSQVWLANSPLAKNVGPVLNSPLLTVNPVEAKTYQHLEYDPLVNPRSYAVGGELEILNTALDQQYRAFLYNNLYRDELGAEEQLSLVYYLQLQDRLEDAFTELAKINEEELVEKIQWAYLQAWMALRNLEIDKALALATPYVDYPVPRWQKRFSELTQAIQAARGAEVANIEDPDRQQDLNQLAAQEPSIELEMVSGKLMLTTHQLTEVTLNLYPMDIELLFSRKPFLAEGGSDFAVIKPAFSMQVKVKGNGDTETLELPKAYRDQNMMVELSGKGKQASVAWYANQLKVRKMESFGQVEVRASTTNTMLPKTYIKVFARSQNGEVSFWKDGYTDLRGRFDYLSLNNRKPEDASEFAILILHPEFGAEIITAEPPTR
ncbi:hypothetical protein P3T73_00685 [Kiritimatiellota bacterium B12222]|nr:hypothetical protein P3T73_00685 [Kiritimatiellota bacterium B12222]